MKIPGPIVAGCLTGVTLVITMVLSTELLQKQPSGRTLDANTFGKNESLELKLQVKNQGELYLKATGASTTVVVQSLRQILSRMDGTILLEKS